jgi:hypothetical protein
MTIAPGAAMTIAPGAAMTIAPGALLAAATAAKAAKAAKVAAEAAAEPSQPEPQGPAQADDGSTKKRPGAWADSGQREKIKSTHYISPEEMKERLANPEVPALPAPAIAAPHIQIVTGDRASVAVPLTAGEARLSEWSIGSHADRHVVIPDHGVSAFHARIVNDGKRWKLVDQMSANGTFVNGKRSNVSYLARGDRLRFGPVDCVFYLPAGFGPGGKSRWLGVTIALVAAVAVALAVAYKFLLHR